MLVTRRGKVCLQNVVFPSLRDSQAQHPGFAALPVLTSRLFWKEKVTHRTTMQHTTQKPTAATTVVEGQERPHSCRGLWFVTSLLALGLFGVDGLVGLTVSCLVFVFELRWGTRLGEAPHPLKSPIRSIRFCPVPWKPAVPAARFIFWIPSRLGRRKENNEDSRLQVAVWSLQTQKNSRRIQEFAYKFCLFLLHVFWFV